MSIALAVVAVIVLFILVRSFRIASEWQRAVILRLGRFHKVKGPGIYLVFPFIDAVAQLIDLRIRTTIITAEQRTPKPPRSGSPTISRRSSRSPKPRCGR
jgi:regulator of protease activity HflC (stomatin/prohibitin superfamily)